MSQPRDDQASQPPTTPEMDGDAYAASSSESGGNYDDEGATTAAPQGEPMREEDEGEPMGEGPDIGDAHRSGS